MAGEGPDGTRLVLAALGGLVGLVFVLQGLGVPIGRSFMVGDLLWTAIGGAMVAVAAAVAIRASGRR